MGLGERGRQVVGYVEDTGIGIAPEDVPRVFEELFRSAAAREIDEHGTGLGLSIARRIVTMCGGEIHVESAVDRGSTFTFSFPALGEGRVAMGEGVPGVAAVVAARGEDRAP